MSDQQKQILPQFNNTLTFSETYVYINAQELKKYQDEIAEKNLIINSLKKEKNSLYDDVINKNNLINQHETKIKELDKEIEKLEEENKLLKEKIKDLEEKNNKSDARIKLLEENVNNLKNDIEELKHRDEPITVREGFVSLEKYIMIDIVQSKRKARSFYGIKDLFNSKQYDAECKSFLSSNKITIDHINLIQDMKEYGNKSAHERPTITKNEFEKMALSLLQDDDDKAMAKDLLAILESKNPYDKSTGLWEIKKPY